MSLFKSHMVRQFWYAFPSVYLIHYCLLHTFTISDRIECTLYNRYKNVLKNENVKIAKIFQLEIRKKVDKIKKLHLTTKHRFFFTISIDVFNGLFVVGYTCQP